MSSPVTITHATREDVPHILALINELAGYEHALSSVEATPSTLLSTLRFAGPDGHPAGEGWANTLIARVPASSSNKPKEGEHSYVDERGEVVGMALYFTSYSTWRAKPGVYLEDLVVREEFRGRGYGKALIRKLAGEVKRIDGGRLEWSCLKWNEPSLKFYRGLGATEMQEWVGLRVDGEALEKLAE